MAKESKGISPNKKYNIYNLSGEYGIGYTSKGEEFYFDLEDYELIKDYCWHINDKGYVVARNLNVCNKIIRLHRLLFPNSKVIDHKNHRKHDNRKCNLRQCTQQENTMNQKLRSDNNSRITGVCFDKRNNTWRSYINVNKTRIHLGYFKNLDDAIKTRKQAEEKYFGEFSYDNSIIDGDNYVKNSKETHE